MDIIFGKEANADLKMSATRQNEINVVIALPFACRDGMDKYNGVMRYLRESGRAWNLRIVRNIPNAAFFDRCLALGISGVICGITTFECFTGDRPDANTLLACLRSCQRKGIPFVGLDWPLKELGLRPSRRESFLNIDSERIGNLAAEVLLRAGNHSSYGFVGSYPGCAWARERGAAFAHGVRKTGRRNVRIFDGDPFMDADGVSAWLKALPKPAAVFASNDCVADVVLRICRNAGLRVPEDLSVLGVDDDLLFCEHARPTLSSVHPDFEAMGFEAARELDRLIAKKKAHGRRMVVAGSPKAVERMSTAPCSPAGSLVRRVDEIILERVCRRLTSDMIAGELKVSRRLMDLRYRQLKGMTVRDAIVQARVRRAKHLLNNSNYSIGTISAMCGYQGANYLGKVFFTQEGLTMGEYRLKKKRINSNHN